MFSVVASFALVAVAVAAPHRETVVRAPAVQPTFEEFKVTFNKSFASDNEDAVRKAIYEDNIDFINQHNAKFVAGKATYDMGVNEYTHLSHDEFKALFIGPKIPTREAKNVAKLPTRAWLTGTADAVDWRAKGAVTPVKNQGQCGSCWSFSTTGSTEGRVQIATGKLNALSEQQLMDCSTKEGDHSCQGGLMDYGFQYIIDNKGIDSETDYPYQMKNEACKTAKEKNVVSTITGFKDVTPKSEADLATAVSAGPVSVAIEADQRGFQSYKSGVFSGDCGTKLDHGVLAVGYGDGYWIVKNSWGATWGMEGYIELARGSSAAGECGIAMQPSFPIAGAAPPPGPTPPGPAPPSPPPPGPSPPGPSGGHYEDPNAGPCSAGEEAIQITGIQGSFCSPKCKGIFNTCPKDVPDGATAQPKCVLETAGSQKPTQCALICTPSGDAGECPTDATCKAISGTGLCTYDQ